MVGVDVLEGGKNGIQTQCGDCDGGLWQRVHVIHGETEFMVLNFNMSTLVRLMLLSIFIW